MPKKQIPHFENEAQEAEWWFQNQDLIAEQLKEAAAAGRLQQGTAVRVARERAAQAGASPLPDVPHLKMLLHEALEHESKNT